MTTPLKIQVALQGGGAKLSPLLAAMEPLQVLHRKNHLNVTRIAGTSAGAIVASLFAADVELSNVRERLKRFNAEHWKKKFPESKLSAAMKLSRGKPLWSDDFFRDELKYFFDGKDVRNVEDTYDKFGTKLLLLATNLRESRPEVYSEGELIPRILDSCGLPFCFRVWNRDQSPVIVDGGICENLPSDLLVVNEEELGPVYAISFPQPDRQSPNNALTFTYALLDTAINHSVARAKDVLGPDNVFHIRTEIGTFDFPYAFSDKSDKEYGRIRQDAENFFSNIGRSQQKVRKTVSGYEWSLQNRSVASLGRVFESHYMDTKIKYSETSLEVHANSLLDPPESDYVVHRTVFRTLDEPVYCLGFSMHAENDLSLDETEFEVFKKTSLEPIATTSLPSVAGMEGPGETLRKRLLVFFLPRLEPNSEEYEVTLKTTVKDFMKPLREEKVDYLSIAPYLTEETVGRLSIVLHLPLAFHDIRMFQQEELGQRMTAGELSTFANLKKFKKYGWTARDLKVADLPPSKMFRVEILPVKK